MITPTSLNTIKEQIKKIIDSIESIANLSPGETCRTASFSTSGKKFKETSFSDYNFHF